jgi:phage gpG-like protein
MGGTMEPIVDSSDPWAVMLVNVETLSATAFPAIVEDFHRMETQRWSADGPGWASLTDATIRIKSRNGKSEPGRILWGDGKLRDALSSRSEGSVVEILPNELLVGADLPYAQYHQTGPHQIKVFRNGSAILPERVLVEVTQADADRWGALIMEALNRG